jgi:Sec7-like guanine-nucleotide exchange factor
MPSAFETEVLAALADAHQAFGEPVEIRPMRKLGQNGAPTVDLDRPVTATSGIFSEDPTLFQTSDGYDPRTDNRLPRSGTVRTVRIRTEEVPYPIRVEDRVERVGTGVTYAVSKLAEAGPGHVILLLSAVKG